MHLNLFWFHHIIVYTYFDITKIIMNVIKSNLFSFLLVVLFFAPIAVSANWSTKVLYEGAPFLGMGSYGTSVIGAVGIDGIAMQSADGGDSWELLVPPTTARLYSISYADADSMVIVGAGGEILVSNDSGDTWSTPTSGTTSDLRDVYMTSSSIGYAVGKLGTILKTTDGGATWATKSILTTTQLTGLDFYNSILGWVVGDNGEYYGTINGGTTWVADSTGTTEDLKDVEFVSMVTGFIVGENGTALKTTDSGNSWTQMTGLGSENLYGVDFYSSTYGVVVGQTSLYITKDGGTTWADLDSQGDIATYDVQMLSNSDIFIAGANSTELSAFVYRWDDAGPSAPTVSISSDNPTSDSTATCTWTDATDEISVVASYRVSTDGVSFTNIGDVNSYALTGLTEGTTTCYVQGVDAAINIGDTGSASVVVDTTGPSVSVVTPISATAGTAKTFSTTAIDSVAGVSACTLYINGVSAGAMTANGSTYSKSYNFSVAGNYSTYAVCSDSVGNSTTGSSTTITVAAASSGSTSTDSSSDVISDSSSLSSDILIKMQCVDSTNVNDPCRAVYYYASTDGKRHAFPNEKIYFTWYSDFDDIVIVSDDVMASISLGKNVTYHPGTKMVKFQTVNTVYVVKQGGVLRAISSEEVATDLYGSTWNKQIDDISDAFFGNYSFGSDVNSATDYNVAGARNSVSSLSDNF